MKKILKILPARDVVANREGGSTFPITLAMGILDELNEPSDEPILVMVCMDKHFTPEVFNFIKGNVLITPQGVEP